MFCGRIDNQVQIQGYRVELGEIEKHARDVLSQPNTVAVAVENEPGSTEIYLFTENRPGSEDEVRNYLASMLPSYMLPAYIINLDELPKLTSGKIDRMELYKMTRK
jgi:acyl-coenzyme A synthetase/AMP-(fatty) acid ligase